MKEKRDGASVTYGIAIGAIFARLLDQAKVYAGYTGLSEDELTNWLGELFSGHKSGEVLRSENRVPSLSKKTTKSTKRKSEVEVASESRRTPPAKKNKISPWAKFNTPLKRRKEMARRLAMRKAA